MDIAGVDTREMYAPRTWPKALAASVSLHLVLLVWLAGPRAEDSRIAELAAMEPRPPALQLKLAARNPQRPHPEPATEDMSPTEIPVVAGSAAAIIETLPGLSNSEAIAEPIPVPDAATTTVQSSVPGDSASPPPPAPDTRPLDGDTAWSLPALRSAITTYVRSTHQQTTGEWLAACRIYQKQHGTQDCPQQAAADYSGKEAFTGLARQAFASVLRPQQHMQLRKEFAAGMADLKPLMKVSGVLGELAAERFYRDRRHLNYLSGNVDFGIRAFVQASQGMQYNPNFLQPLCRPGPCIFEYTGVGATVSAAPASAQPVPGKQANAEAEASAPFMLRQTLFGSPR